MTDYPLRMTERPGNSSAAVVTAARYDVLPAEARLAITVDLTITNRLKDTVTRQYYFDRAYIAVMPGTANFKVIPGSGTATPIVVVTHSIPEAVLLADRVVVMARGRRIAEGTPEEVHANAAVQAAYLGTG